MKWLLIVAGILANASASVLVKLALRRPLVIDASLLTNWRLILAVGSYGLAFLLYAAAVSRLPINVAHPLMTAGAIAVVGVASVVVVGESFTVRHGIGYGLLAIGIFVLASIPAKA
jgi:small multidrug resistance pump